MFLVGGEKTRAPGFSSRDPQQSHENSKLSIGFGGYLDSPGKMDDSPRGLLDGIGRTSPLSRNRMRFKTGSGRGLHEIPVAFDIGTV